MLRRFRGSLTYANVVSTLCLFIVLGGTSYAVTKLDRNSVRSKHIKNGQVKRGDLARNAVDSSKVADRSLTARDFAAGQLPAGPKGDKGDAGPAGPAGATGAVGPEGATGVIARSYAWSAAAIPLPATPPTNSQVNLLNAPAPGEAGGTLEVDRPGQLHVHADVLIGKNQPGAGGRASCGLRMNGEAIANGSVGSFGDSGPDPEGNPSRFVITLPLNGAKNVEPGTYNVGILCFADRPDLATVRGAEFTAVVYAG